MYGPRVETAFNVHDDHGAFMHDFGEIMSTGAGKKERGQEATAGLALVHFGSTVSSLVWDWECRSCSSSISGAIYKDLPTASGLMCFEWVSLL